MRGGKASLDYASSTDTQLDDLAASAGMVIGRSDAMRELAAQVRQVAAYPDITVLLQGESGAEHALGVLGCQRHDQPITAELRDRILKFRQGLPQRHERRHRTIAFQRFGKLDQKFSGRVPKSLAWAGKSSGQRLGQGFLQRARQHDQIVADAPQAAHQRVRVGRIG